MLTMLNMLTKRLGFLFLILIVITGCASKPRLSGKGKLCGIVVDENNVPVSSYVISCRREKGIWKHGITNDEGLFFFEDMPFGNYTFKGSKECYLNFYDEGYVFNNLGKVYCFQLSSIDKALDLIEEKIICEDYDQALEMLNNINTGNEKEAQKVVIFYEDFINKKMEEKNAENNVQEKEL